MMAKKESGERKILPLILRADVQGSLEALKTSLMKIHSDKVRLEIVSADVGEISESDIALAAASKATVLYGCGDWASAQNLSKSRANKFGNPGRWTVQLPR
jgi:translation initiation factor IF-2